jgi:acyl carrier protein
MEPYESEVRQFVVDNFLFGEGENGLSVHDSLLEKGLIDSTGVLELVGFVQTRFGLTVEDEEIIPANLDSIYKVAQFIRHKKGETGGQSNSDAGSDH